MIVHLRANTVNRVEANGYGRPHFGTRLAASAIDAVLRATASGRLLTDGKAGAAADVADWNSRRPPRIGHARRPGWLSPDGRHARAHVGVVP